MRLALALLAALFTAQTAAAEQQTYVVDDGATTGVELRGTHEFPSEQIQNGSTFHATVTASLAAVASNLTVGNLALSGCTLLNTTSNLTGTDVLTVAYTLRANATTCSWSGEVTGTHTPTGVGQAPNTVRFRFSGSVATNLRTTTENTSADWLQNVSQFAWLFWLLYFAVSRFIRGHVALRIMADTVAYGLLALPVPASQFQLLAGSITAVLAWDLIVAVERPSGEL